MYIRVQVKIFAIQYTKIHMIAQWQNLVLT